MKRKGIFSIILVIVALMAWSVAPSQADNGVQWQYHTADNGLPLNDILTMGEDAEGNLWIGSALNGAAVHNGSGWTTLNTEDGLTSNMVQSVAFDSDVTYLGHWGSGLTILTDSEPITLRDGIRLQSTKVDDIAIEENGDLWLAHKATGTMMAGGGVTHIIDGSQSVTYDFIGSATSNAVYAVELDANGNVWFAVGDYWTHFESLEGGLVMHNGEAWTTYTEVDGLASTDVVALAIDGNNVWASTTAGISLFDGKAWTTYTTADGLLNNWNMDIEVDSNGTVWALSQDGVNYFADGEWQVLTSEDGLLEGNVTTMALDADGDIMFAGEAGISRLNSETTTEPTPEMTHQVFMPIVTTAP